MSKKNKGFDFKTSVERLLLSMGATRQEKSAYGYDFQTDAGLLECAAQEDWVATRFEDPAKARGIIPGGNLNPYSGKWNFHYTKPGAAELRDFAQMLACVLVDDGQLEEAGYDRDSYRGPNTRIGYMYRDAHNYKSHGEVVLAGAMPERAMKLLLSLSLNDGSRFFIPGMVGLQDLQNSFSGCESEWHDDRDHPWHTFTSIDPTDRAPTIDMTVDQLADRFIQVAINGGFREDYQPEFYEEMVARKNKHLTDGVGA